jgi:polysaccharide chain length determinant protein (PEP-CTERM system associated)
MENTSFHALDYVSVVSRRKWWLIVPVVLSIVTGLVLLRVLPREYRSSTTLAVAAPMVSPTFVNQGNTLDDQERIRAISQQMLSLPVLARVVKEEGLADGRSADEQIAQLRRAITISVPDPVAELNEPRRIDAFDVAYTDSSPERAQRIADRLAQAFLEANAQTRTARAEDTSAFIATQLKASESRMVGLEERLRVAKESHMGRLPEQTQANLQTLTGLRQQLEANATALRSEQDRLTILERQLETVAQNSQPRAVAADGTMLAGASREQLLERQLAAARQTYTERHPEVQRLQQELADAKAETAARLKESPAARAAQLEGDPAYRQLMNDREAARLRIRELQRAADDTRGQISSYQARVESAPLVEQQLATLQRDYDLEKQQYADLTARLRASTIAENVERNRGGEQFTVLYPASFPTAPIKPQPLRVMLLAIAAGICLGGALTLGREYLDRSVHDVRELKDELSLPILGEVAHIQTT